MNRNSYRSIKYDKAFAFKLDFEGRNIPVIEKEYHKIETKMILILVCFYIKTVISVEFLYQRKTFKIMQNYC